VEVDPKVGFLIGEFLKWLGMPQDRPLATSRRAILAINAILSGEPVEGWLPEAYLRFEPRRRVPIYLAAFSPNMLRLTGEIADGALPLLFPPEHYDTVAPLIAEGAAKAGRSMDEIDFAACVWCSIGQDRDAARSQVPHSAPLHGERPTMRMVARPEASRRSSKAPSRQGDSRCWCLLGVGGLGLGFLGRFQSRSCADA
jgi:5,10-methylenetetrahydromethanopterin reductase